jgi:hypothetical protein
MKSTVGQVILIPPLQLFNTAPAVCHGALKGT